MSIVKLIVLGLAVIVAAGSIAQAQSLDSPFVSICHRGSGGIGASALCANGDWYRKRVSTVDHSWTYEGNLFELVGEPIPTDKSVVSAIPWSSFGIYAVCDNGDLYWKQDAPSGEQLWSFAGNVFVSSGYTPPDGVEIASITDYVTMGLFLVCTNGDFLIKDGTYDHNWEYISNIPESVGVPHRIQSVEDVPEDQGGQVVVTWSRSAYDRQGASTPITIYTVQRHDLDWIDVAEVPANAQPVYDAPVDANTQVFGEPEPWSVYRVIAHTADPGTFYISDPDSGYAIDNMAPPVPEATLYQGETHWIITWLEPEIPDLAESCIYRSYSQDFDLETPLECSDAFLYIEDQLVMQYFAVRFRDIHGNWGELSPAVGPSDITAAPDDVPQNTGLLVAYPNPFNPGTVIVFALDQPQHVNLSVYNLDGALVRRLVSEHRGSGRHEIPWNGRDESDRAVAAGVYFYRLEADGYTETRRMTLVR